MCPAAMVLTTPVPVTEHEACPVTDVLRRVGDKWSVLVVVLLGGKSFRYNELLRSIEGISQRMLTRTLRGLERDGLVSRTVFPTNPQTVEYALTDLGGTLLEPLQAVTKWALDHSAEVGAARSEHDAQAEVVHRANPTA